MVSSRPGACVHLDHVFWWRFGKVDFASPTLPRLTDLVWHASGVTTSTRLIANEPHHDLCRPEAARTPGILAFSAHVQHLVESITWTRHPTSWLYDEFPPSRIDGVDHVARAMGHHAGGILPGPSRHISACIPVTSNVVPTFPAALRNRSCILPHLWRAHFHG